MACITLLSDFGVKDASVAIAKGILMQHTRLPLFDISHEVSPYHTAQAAYLLTSGYRHFPLGTIHVVLFDLFSDKTPRLVLSLHEGHYFLSPDNGVVPLAIGGQPEKSWLCYELKTTGSFTDWLTETGRIVAKLGENRNISAQLPEYEIRNLSANFVPSIRGGAINCDVIHVDQYENVVINVTREFLNEQGIGPNFRLQFMQMEEISEISNGYTDMRQGYKLCRFNSSGYLEISINRGKAASLFGLRLGGKNNIKIYLE